MGGGARLGEQAGDPAITVLVSGQDIFDQDPPIPIGEDIGAGIWAHQELKRFGGLLRKSEPLVLQVSEDVTLGSASLVKKERSVAQDALIKLPRGCEDGSIALCVQVTETSAGEEFLCVPRDHLLIRHEGRESIDSDAL